MGVKSLRRCFPSVLLALSLLLAACAVRAVGLVEPDAEDRVWLLTAEGQQYRLILRGEAEPMRFLEGHIAEVEGWRIGRRLTVEDWQVPEGLLGLPTWVGRLERHDGRLGLHDRNSNSFYWVDPEDEEAVEHLVGLPVLLEGYVERALQVRVVTFRVLAPPDAVPQGVSP